MDFYIDKFFEYQGLLYGRLRFHSADELIRFVKVTKAGRDFTNWSTVEYEVEEQLKKHFEQHFKSEK